MTTPQLEEAIGLCYMRVDTEVGSRVYGLLQCFRQDYPGQNELKPYRQSAPFVISQQCGRQNILVGSVYNLLDGVRHLLNDLAESSKIHVTQLHNEKYDRKGDLFLEYARKVTNNLILISGQSRNLFHIFPRLAEKLSIPIFAYEGNQDDNIKINELSHLQNSNSTSSVKLTDFDSWQFLALIRHRGACGASPRSQSGDDEASWSVNGRTSPVHPRRERAAPVTTG